MRTYLLLTALGLSIASAAAAGEVCKAPTVCTKVQMCGSPNRCGHCSRAYACKKYCRVVCEMKEVKKTVWVVKCSEFCAPLPGRGRNCCHGCGSYVNEAGCCNDCGKKCDPCASLKHKRFVPPKCGRVREKKTLEKKKIICKVPSYKCVVVYCCPHCEYDEGCGGQQVYPPPAQPAPPPASALGKTTRKAPLPPVLGASFVK